MIVTDLVCPECGAPMVYKQSRYKPFYGCSTWHTTKCPGTHGAHPDGTPMGKPADVATKRARMAAHAAFDRLWKDGRMKRKHAYAWVREAMQLSEADGHISMMNAEQCKQLIALVEHELAPERSK